ncbi:efflux RND transporter permease subunit, partial [bacterium]
IAFLAFCAGTLLLIPLLGQDFFPSVDAGQFRLHIRARTGTRIEETVKLVNRVESAIRQEILPSEIGGILDNIGVPGGGLPLTYIDNGLVGTGDADVLVSLKTGHHPTADYVKRLRSRLNREFPGTTFYFLPADIVNQTINFSLPAPIDIQIAGRELEQNHALAEQLAQNIRRIPGAVDVRVQQITDQPELQFAVDRTKASEIGMSERDVANQVLLNLSGSSQTQPNYWVNPVNGVQYPVNVRVPEYAISSISALNSMPVSGSQPGKNNTQVLANLAPVTLKNTSPIYSHYDVQPVIDVYAGISSRDLGGVLEDVAPLIEKVNKQLPKGSFIMVRGQAETMRSSLIGLVIGLLMAIALVYLLLVVNYQSWLDPFIIITGITGSLAGVIWGLYLTFTTISIPALLGAIMSVGVGTANSILLVTFARDNMRKGMDPLTAVWEAGTTRLRPVLMTALAMIIGMFPMALGLGEGGEQNAPLGRAVIGGLAMATFATLFLVPAMFRLLHTKTLSSPSPDELGVLSDKIN